MEITVSIILPVYNHAEYVSKAIDSVLTQELQNFELIVVDDGSTDALADVIAHYGDKRIKLIRHEKNLGAAEARNSGIRQATGKYVAFLDADDFWVPSKLRQQLELLVNSPADIKACSSYFSIQERDGSVVHRAVQIPYQDQSDLVFGCTCSPGSTLVVERKCFDEIGFFDASFRRFEDWDWLLRYTRHYKIATLENETAMVRRARVANFEDTRMALELITDRHLNAAAIPSGFSRLKLRSSIFLEKSASYYRVNKHHFALLYAMLSILVYPFRNMVFYKRMLSIVSGIKSS